MRIEEELILGCARTSIDGRVADTICHLIRQDVDWAYVLDMCHRHGISPLLYRSLTTLCQQAAPESVMKRLKERFYWNLAHNLRMEAELASLLDLFRTQGIAAIPYKGPALATTAYGNLALRVFSDLDILIQKWDIQKAVELMISLDYRPDIRCEPEQMAAYIETFYELPFTHTTKASVELQWEICADHFAFPIDPLDVWAEPTAAHLQTSGYRSIPAERLLLMLCVHGAKDSWARLAWICDVAELLRQSNNLDWDSLVKLATRTGGLRMLFLGLSLANQLLDAPVPRLVLDRIAKDRVVTASVQTIRRSLFEETPEPPPGILETCLFYISLRERLRDKVRFWFRTFSRPIPGRWDQLGLDGPVARISNVIRHVLMSLSYGLELAKQKWKGQGEATG